jgi:hypothetical protein
MQMIDHSWLGRHFLGKVRKALALSDVIDRVSCHVTLNFSSSTTRGLQKRDGKPVLALQCISTMLYVL